MPPCGTCNTMQHLYLSGDLASVHFTELNRVKMYMTHVDQRWSLLLPFFPGLWGWRVDEWVKLMYLPYCDGDVTDPRCGMGKQVGRCCRARGADITANCGSAKLYCSWEEGEAKGGHQWFVWTEAGSLMQGKKRWKGYNYLQVLLFFCCFFRPHREEGTPRVVWKHGGTALKTLLYTFLQYFQLYWLMHFSVPTLSCLNYVSGINIYAPGTAPSHLHASCWRFRWVRQS